MATKLLTVPSGSSPARIGFIVAALAAIVLLAGCTSIIDAEPVKEKQTAVHCDLIFPPASVDP